ncbi:MAG: signal peptide peptidase SppA [Phycisphaeraceae bacterium]|nr:signal peptide peptidase SppA [Phycisphaeraceae bacterium]
MPHPPKSTYSRCLPLLAAALSLLLAGCGPITFTIGGAPEEKLQPTIVEKDVAATRNRVAIIDVSGLIHNGERFRLLGRGENPVSLLHEQLQAARQDSRVKAVILRINSPGGTVTASDAMYRQIQRFRQRTGKPVVACLLDVAASGGYYVACSADQIVAYPTTITGSIGVIVQTISLKPALGRIGVETDAITSGPNKDAGSPLSKLTPAQRAMLQKLVDDFYSRFVDVVRQARPAIAPERLPQLTDGRVMGGQEALAAGLVDQVGDLYTALDLAKQKAAISNADLVIYHRPSDYVGSPYAQAPSASGQDTALQVNLAQINLGPALGNMGTGFYYLWDPTLP